MKEIWEFHWIIDEKDWGVVSDHVVVTLLGVELDSKSSWVSNSVWRSSLTSDGGESKEAWGLLTNLIQESGLGVFGHISGNFENTVGSGSLGVDNSLWNSFSVEVGKFVNEGEVLEKDWSSWASSHGVLVVVNWVT